MTNGVMPSPYQGTAVDASQAIEDAAGPLYGNVFSMALKSGDSWSAGAKAYLAGDPQTLTSAVTGNPVAIFQGLSVTSAASGTYGDFLVAQTYQAASGTMGF
jgi:hypothetical protein